MDMPSRKELRKMGKNLLSSEEIDGRFSLLRGWKINKSRNKISKTFLFDDFAKSLQFVNKVGNIAEKMNHHPNIFLSYGKARFVLNTHIVKSLSEKDFILASKIDRI